MAVLILVALIAVPLVEIAIFIEVGGLLGLWPTIALVVATAIAGTALLRHQGLATLLRVRADLEVGRLPVEALFDGLCLLVAGALLLTPGFVTDGLGLALFVPPLRALLRQAMRRHLVRAGQDPGIIDGEFEEIRPVDTPPGDTGNGTDAPPATRPPPRIEPRR